mgnify:CR=1 FL=1
MASAANNLVSPAVSLPLFLSLALFAISSILVLLFSLLDRKKARNLIKIIPCLSLSALFFSLGKGCLFIGLSFLFAALGDLGLIFKSHRRLVDLGCLSFFLAHLCGIATLSSFFLLEARAIFAAAMLYYSFFLLLGLEEGKKIAGTALLGGLGGVYFGSLLLYEALFVIATILVSPYFAIGAIGMLIFILSDSLIVINAKIKPIKKRDFLVMLTYLFGQGLIALSYLLAYLY